MIISHSPWHPSSGLKELRGHFRDNLKILESEILRSAAVVPKTDMGDSINEVSHNGWFIVENPNLDMDDD